MTAFTKNQVKIKIKPLSTNKAWKGRRFKTKEYESYERTMGYLLPAHYPIPKGNLHVLIEAGFSNKASDLDNVCKQTLDILSKVYGFNDSLVYKITMTKKIISKGSEYIAFSIESVV